MSMSSRAPAATPTTMLRASETAGTDHLWAKAAELERDFAGYKRRLAERRAQHAAVVAEAAGRRAGVGGEEEEEKEEEERAGGAAGRGRKYEEYMRRRDERLRQEWRARMERKEAEVQALWARLDRGSSRRGGDDRDGELAAATGHAREYQVNPPQKPGNLVVKVKPSTAVTPRGNPGHSPAAKLVRPRTSVPSSLAAGSPSPRLSTPDPRRRPSHLHRVQPQTQAQPQPQPPATPRKENNRLPPPPPPSAALAAAASPATPRPRTTTMLSRSRSMFKDRGCSSVAVGESPRPPRFQPPRSGYDGASASSNLKEPTPSPSADDSIAVARSGSCSMEPAVVADRKKAASAVAPKPFLVKRSSGNDIEPTSTPLVALKERDLPYSSEITPAGCGNADNKSNQQECVDESSDRFGGEEITGDSDTEPSYVYIKKDSDEQIPRPPPQASAGVGTCPAPEPRSDNKEDSDNVEDNMESTGSNEVAGETPAADAEEEFRRESSESLYSNVQSSFSARSELDTSATGSPLPSAAEQSPESNTAPWTRKSTEVEDAEKRPPTPATPRSSVQSPMDAVNGLKRLLTFGKRNGKASEAAAAVERTAHSVQPFPPAGGDGSVSRECPAGGSAKLTVDSSESDDLDNSYVISPHVGSLQSIGPSYPASSEPKESVLHAKSPRVHRSFFSFSSFKSRAN